MKKHFTLIFTLFLILLQIPASAQGEWKWAHYWSGGDGSFGDYFNEITNTAFDEEGNIYVYGIMGGNPTIDGMTFQFTQAGSVLGMNDKTILLAKFDTLGNMLWYKVVKNSTQLSFPLWMEVRNDKVYVAGNCAFTGDAQNSWTYYMDTLVYKYQCSSIPVEQQHPPFKPGRKSMWTFFAQLDLEGNLIEDHFVDAITRLHYWNGADTLTQKWYLCENTISPIHVCNDGSICVFTTINYNDKEEYPYTIVVDEDTNKTYDLYFPGSTLPQNNIWNFIMFKFTPNWELDFAKLLVDHADGIAPIITEIEGTSDTLRDYISPFFHGMTFDEDDNMYLTGRLSLAQWMPGSGGELNNFPVHIWWDGNHHTTMDDISSAEQCSFILKYNPMGELLWNNQPHTLVQNSATDLALVEYRKSTFDDNSIYVLGKCGCYNSGHIYFDNPQQTLVQNPATLTNLCFFVRYNAATGEYQSHGVRPPENMVGITRKPAIINDRVLAITMHGSQKKLFLTTWRKDGTFIKNDTISSLSKITNDSYGILKKDDTHLAVALQATSPQSFGDIYLNCPSNQSSAVVAYYYDPSLAEPLPEDSTGIAEYEAGSSNLRIWPNPANNILHIESANEPIDHVCILDLNGKTLIRQSLKNVNPVVNITDLPAGIYIVKTICDDRIAVGKFVKTN